MSMSQVHEGLILKKDANHVTYSRHTKEWVMFICKHHVTRHGTHMNESFRAHGTHRQCTHECASSQNKTLSESFHMHKNESCHTYECVMSCTLRTQVVCPKG